MDTTRQPTTVDCPDDGCCWYTTNPDPFPVVETHLIEDHGYSDPTTSAMLAEVTA